MIDNIAESIKFYSLNAPIVAYVLVFLGGILLSFTPCIYPLIPVIIGYVGGYGEKKSLAKAFLLSILFVIGMSITLAFFGFLASIPGKYFGFAAPIGYKLAGLTCLVMGISMLGLFKINIPTPFSRINVKRKGYLGAFFSGLVFGLIPTACATPVIFAILGYVFSVLKNPLLGTSLLFVFGIGQGIILIFAGTFTGFLKNLPKSGKWLNYIEKISGILLIFVSLYFFLYNLIY